MRNAAAGLIRFLDSTAQRPLVAFVAIFVLSAAVRLVILLRISDARVAGFTEADLIGRSLAENGTFSDPYVVPTGPTAHTSPFYPLLVSFIYRLFGTGLVGGYARCIATILAYSLLFGLLPYFARRLGFPAAAGVLAGLLSAAVPLNRSAEVFWGWEEPYAAMVFAFLLFYTLALWKHGGVPALSWALYGTSWGLALHIAPALLPVQLSTCLVHLTFFSSEARLKMVRLWALSLAATIVVLLPWTYRNHARLGGWIYMRSVLGENLYESNNDESSPSAEQNYASGVNGQVAAWINRDAALWIRANGELAYQHLLFRKAVVWIREHPRRFLALTGERVLYFWFGPFEHPLFALFSTVTSVLGLFGIRMIKRRIGRMEFWLFAATFSTYPLVYYFVHYTSRYRVPIRWMLVLAACWFIYHSARGLADGVKKFGTGRRA